MPQHAVLYFTNSLHYDFRRPGSLPDDLKRHIDETKEHVYPDTEYQTYSHVPAHEILNWCSECGWEVQPPTFNDQRVLFLLIKK